MVKEKRWTAGNSTWVFVGWQNYASKFVLQLGAFVFTLKTREPRRKRATPPAAPVA